MKLYDLAATIRSKNAGPFTLTVDVVFGTTAELERVLRSPAFTAERIGFLYGVRSESVRICPFPRVKTVKVTFPRPGPSSGAPGDGDVYGCQQHFPLAGIEIH